jgi:hypothetical protein
MLLAGFDRHIRPRLAGGYMGAVRPQPPDHPPFFYTQILNRIERDLMLTQVVLKIWNKKEGW